MTTRLPILGDAHGSSLNAATVTHVAHVATVANGPQARAWSLRISVIEQCAQRCPYCLPSALRPATRTNPPMHRLGPAEHARLAPIFRSRGVQKVRFTGGEPLQRPDVADIVAAWKEAHPRAELALTTNGRLLVANAEGLRASGLQRVTIHLDTLRADRYGTLMGDGTPAAILDAVDVARATFDVVKLNVVVQRGGNDDELLDMLALSRERGVEVRFIELMNTGSAATYVRDAFLSGADIVARIAAARGAHPLPRRHPSDPAALHRTDDGVVFGVIASDTEPFCGACDRLRLTADGRLRGCLYESGGVPLGAALHAGADDNAVAALVDAAIAGKRSFHPLAAPHRVPFSMADVGGDASRTRAFGSRRARALGLGRRSLNDRIHDGNDEQREQRERHEPAEHGRREALHDVGADAGRQHHRHEPEDVHRHRHQDRPQALARACQRCIDPFADRRRLRRALGARRPGSSPCALGPSA